MDCSGHELTLATELDNFWTHVNKFSKINHLYEFALAADWGILSSLITIINNELVNSNNYLLSSGQTGCHFLIFMPIIIIIIFFIHGLVVVK